MKKQIDFRKLRTVKLQIFEDREKPNVPPLTRYHSILKETPLSFSLSLYLESRKLRIKTYKILATLYRSAWNCQEDTVQRHKFSRQKEGRKRKNICISEATSLGDSQVLRTSSTPFVAENRSKKYRARSIRIYSGAYRAADRGRSRYKLTK